MEECFVHYTSGKEEKLLSLSSKSTWETILNAARIKKKMRKLLLLQLVIMKRSIHRLDFIKLDALCLQ